MTALSWSEALALKQPRMDQTHREFVDLLQELATAFEAGATDVMARLDELHEHTVAHFAQEERWMADIGFALENCHAGQHQQVLHVLREVKRVVSDGTDPTVVGVLVEELGKWFVGHAQMMDGALADTMLARGYDPETGRQVNPLPADTPPMTGCGGNSCS